MVNVCVGVGVGVWVVVGSLGSFLVCVGGVFCGVLRRGEER